MTILTKGGLVLWWYQDQMVQHLAEDFSKRINDLIHAAILEGTANFNKDNMTLKYRLDNQFDLVFVLGYQTTIKISYADQFLDSIQRLFRDKYKNQLADEFTYNLFNQKQRLNYLNEFTHIFLNEYDTYRGNANQNVTKMRTWAESDKRNKTVQSLRKDYDKQGQTVGVAKNAKKNPKIQNLQNSVGNTTASDSESSDNLIRARTGTSNSDSSQATGEGDNDAEDDDDDDADDQKFQHMTLAEKREFFKMKQKFQNKNKKPQNKFSGNKSENDSGKKKVKSKTMWDDLRGLVSLEYSNFRINF